MALFGDQSLKIVINAKDNASKVFKKFEKNNQKTIENLKKFSVVGGAAIAAIGVASVKMAADFEKSMTNVSTLIDTSTESMEDMEKAVIDISRRTPVALEDLSSALYDVRSAGIDAGDAMEVLENSAKLATTGLGTTKEATNVLTSAINAFGLDAKNSDQIADVFFKTVKSGKTNISELAQGFGQVAPLANELGLRFEDLMATTAAMTTSGMQASVAYTQQRAVLSSLLKPTKDMDEAMKEVGITSDNLSEIVSEEGLTGVIKLLSEAVDGDQASLAKMFGSVEGLNAVMMLLGETGVTSTEIFNNMTQGTNAMDEAMKKQNATASAQYQILKNNLNAEMINLGNVILPLLLAGFNHLKIAVTELSLLYDEMTIGLGELIYKAQQAYEWMQKVASQASISGIGASIGGGIQSGMESIGLPTLNDFISRPGSSPVSFSPQDTIIGVKRPGDLGGQNINVTFNNLSVRDDRDIDKIREVIDDYFRTVLVNNKITG